ncbi:hypothetical protein CR152_00240 [Massilia violaceinigra]|uniref:Uncharacterized protein n=1 Tax=Massilia violaceinigra TaxID=2045208 RepID=A0A2D2DDN4_9BURK|nr:hypothetical protein CR152_00240 [Massilia violaceinigra]
MVLSRTQVDKADELMRAMYRRLGYEQLRQLIARYASRVGVKPGTLRVWELKNRWLLLGNRQQFPSLCKISANFL